MAVGLSLSIQYQVIVFYMSGMLTKQDPFLDNEQKKIKLLK